LRERIGRRDVAVNTNEVAWAVGIGVAQTAGTTFIPACAIGDGYFTAASVSSNVTTVIELGMRRRSRGGQCGGGGFACKLCETTPVHRFAFGQMLEDGRYQIVSMVCRDETMKSKVHRLVHWTCLQHREPHGSHPVHGRCRDHYTARFYKAVSP